jgi:hypothetical protein
MKMNRIPAGLLACTLALSITATGFAHEAHKKNDAAKAATAGAGQLVKITDKEAAWAAKARKEYPLTVCLTSDEKLGSMGDNAEFIYRQAGKPDRLLVFCCAGCEDDFVKEPAKYLAKLDAAAKSKGAPGAKPDAKGQKGE